MSLKEAKRENNQCFIESLRLNDDYSPMEADEILNRSSRQVIVEMEKEHGEAWLVSPNPYGKKVMEKAITDRSKDDWNLYNFCCSYVVPKYDAKLEQMLKDRLAAPYTGTKDDFVHIENIGKRIEKLDGEVLIWS